MVEVSMPQMEVLQIILLLFAFALLCSYIGYLVGRKSGVKDGLLRGQKQGFYDIVNHLQKKGIL